MVYIHCPPLIFIFIWTLDNSSILRAGFSEKASFILGVFLSEVSNVQKFIGLFLKPCNSVGKPKEATVGSTHAAEVLQKCSAVKSSDI